MKLFLKQAYILPASFHRWFNHFQPEMRTVKIYCTKRLELFSFFLLCCMSTTSCCELEKHSTVSAFWWWTSAALHKGFAAGPPETVRKLLAGSLMCTVDIWQREAEQHQLSGILVWQQHPHSCYNESEEPLFTLLVNTCFFFLLFPSKRRKHLVQFTTTRCVCVDILRWEHASFELPLHSTWWAKHSPTPTPSMIHTPKKKKCWSNIGYITLTPLLICT